MTFSLLEFTNSLCSANLENVFIIGEQHIVSSTFDLINTLFKRGLKHENLALIGKCYSTNPYVYAKMIENGINISASSLNFNAKEGFDNSYYRDVFNFYKSNIQKINFQKIDKIIVISDGGVLTQIFQQYADSELNIIGVEQTSSGYEKLKNQKLNFPIINVARSEAKLRYESPFIARITIERLFQKFKSLDIFPNKILIIGNGAIGKEIFLLLEKKFNVSIYDIDASKSILSKEEFKKRISEFDLIIGATGKNTISKNQHKSLKNNAILASVSSSDREFDAVYFRRKMAGTLTDCHRDLFIERIYLMNCGFPVIFDSSYDIIDSFEFQLTRSLLLTGILQAASSKKLEKNFIILDLEKQEQITKYFLKHLHPLCLK